MARYLVDANGFRYGWNADMAKQTDLYTEVGADDMAAPAAPAAPVSTGVVVGDKPFEPPAPTPGAPLVSPVAPVPMPGSTPVQAPVPVRTGRERPRPRITPPKAK